MNPQLNHGQELQHQTTTKAVNIITKHLGHREAEWSGIINRSGPLRLLDLPLDLLQTILKEVTHTNDLAALALTHSALYDLVIPHIYSRFDIVWPDSNPTVESRMGVDALTYGLATLVMDHDVFGENHCQQHKYACTQCFRKEGCRHERRGSKRSRVVRRGNCYAKFTKKFSLGNGPEDWVREYLITKEGGKMLGTLVAIAVGRMRNLEAFTWDMPTGVLRDVWLALASHANRDDQETCKLERIWIRWHDNSDHASLAPTSTRGIVPAHAMNIPSMLTGTSAPIFMVPPYPRVEYPTFSILPPLKSLNVLDIDELSYAEEMSVLIENSLDRLQELRVGMAIHAQHDPWARPQEDKNAATPTLMYSGTSTSRSGGLLGILVGRFRPTKNHSSGLLDASDVDALADIMNEEERALLQDANKSMQQPLKVEPQDEEYPATSIGHLNKLFSSHKINDLAEGTYRSSVSEALDSVRSPPKADPVKSWKTDSSQSPRRLALTTLELERVYLSIPILSHAIEWSRLRSLTLLGCRNHDQLWRALRRRFAPDLRRRATSIAAPTLFTTALLPRSMSGPLPFPTHKPNFELSIMNLHTDTVSSNLLSFIKYTLAPDTLESLFLQQTQGYKTSVTIEQIYKYAIRPHRSSLRKLLVDSDLRLGDASANMSWRHWAFTKELITCITSGRMQLRELGMCINFKDWHYFLQRLPNAAGLRSLHIPYIVDHIHGRADSRDTAQQILNVVALRPELQLCYVGIQSKCFEILELPANRSPSPPPPRRSTNATTTQVHSHNIDDDDDDDDDDDEDNENEDDDISDNNDDDDDYDNTASTSSSDNEESEGLDFTTQEKRRPTFKLREILFYDDKISIFKARHGKL